MSKPACRLYALLARTRRVAVIFRRGPSKQVLLIRWWLESERFEIGQWLKGRIYERRCDLSPDGEKLVYFAQDFGRSPGSWTAVSKPPYLTALAFWPKGDCWGGGGLFDSDITLRLNHRPGDEMRLDPRFKLPKRFRVQPLGDHSGWGEDDPIYHYRQVRDGWWLRQEGHSEWAGLRATVKFPYDPYEIYAKPQPRNARLQLMRIRRGVGVAQGPWVLEDYGLVMRRDSDPRRPPEEQDWTFIRYVDEADWADWDRNGDLLLAKDGRLFRLAWNQACEPAENLLDGVRELADFRELTFTPKKAPLAATRW